MAAPIASLPFSNGAGRLVAGIVGNSYCCRAFFGNQPLNKPVIVSEEALAAPVVVPDLTAPAGLYVTAQPFRVGERTFTRLSFAQPFVLSVKPDLLFQQRFGDKFKIDFCFDEAPMGAHGVASGILDSELPAASINLSLSIRPRDARQ